MQLAFLGCRNAALQVVGEKLVISIPLPIVVEWHQEHVALLEARKLRSTIQTSGQCVAKRSAKSIQYRRTMEKGACFVRLSLQDLGREIVDEIPVPSAERHCLCGERRRFVAAAQLQ